MNARASVLILVFVIAGCALPQWRVFQAKVPANVEKPKDQQEGEKRAAAYIQARTTPPVTDANAAVADVHEVAAGLSASLGQPDEPVTAADKDKIITSLQAGLRAKDAQLDKWKAFGRKYAGKPLEDTGINLAGPAGLVALIAVVAACIACPALGYIVLRALPLLWGFFRSTTAAIGEFTVSHPDAGEQLKSTLSRKMDAAHKALVRAKANLATA